MINEDIFERAIVQYQDVLKATVDSEDNHIVAMNKVLGIDSRPLALLSRALSEDLKETYPENLQIVAAATYGVQMGILAGRQEAIENTSSS